MAFQQRSLIATAGSSLWKSYCTQLKKRPLATKAATGIVGTIIGDCMAQCATAQSIRKKSPPGAVPIFKYDWPRMMRLCAYSAVIGTPFAHYWFNCLDKFVHLGRFTALGKMALDQTLMAPFGIGLFFLSVALMEGQPLGAAVAGAREKLKPTLLANWTIWPAANLVNFAFIPSEQRILYVNVVYVFWASFLSTMAAQKPQEAAVALELKEL